MRSPAGSSASGATPKRLAVGGLLLTVVLACAGLASMRTPARAAGAETGIRAPDAGAPAASLPPDTMLKGRPSTAGEPSRFSDGFGGTTAVIVVVLLGAAAGWALWRRLRMAAPATRGERLLAVAETRSLGNRQYLVVAAYGSRRFLLGVCPGRIDLLSTLEGGSAEPPPSP
ncbi:MAG: flagellar biosynthetic protein FliO [Opitutaceae bacterium]